MTSELGSMMCNKVVLRLRVGFCLEKCRVGTSLVYYYAIFLLISSSPDSKAISRLKF